jgi:hypothetical protein
MARVVSGLDVQVFDVQFLMFRFGATNPVIISHLFRLPFANLPAAGVRTLAPTGARP